MLSSHDSFTGKDNGCDRFEKIKKKQKELKIKDDECKANEQKKGKFEIKYLASHWVCIRVGVICYR